MGYCLDIDPYFIDIYKSVIGLEYAFTKGFKLRCGVENKSVKGYGYVYDEYWDDYYPAAKDVNSTDYSCGFEYDISESFVLECAYKDYQDICGGYDTFGAASEYIADWDYWYSASEERNHLIVGSIKWCF
jgi:hypothetical protein